MSFAVIYRIKHEVNEVGHSAVKLYKNASLARVHPQMCGSLLQRGGISLLKPQWC